MTIKTQRLKLMTMISIKFRKAENNHLQFGHSVLLSFNLFVFET